MATALVSALLVADVLLYASRGPYNGGGDCGGKSCIVEHDNGPLIAAGIALALVLVWLVGTSVLRLARRR